MNEPRYCGVEDVLLAAVDGLKRFLNAKRAAFPEAAVQTSLNRAGYPRTVVFADEANIP